MKIIKITLQKSGYRSQLKDVDELIRAMEADIEKSGFIVTEAEATLNTDVSQYAIAVKGERRGRTDEHFGQHLWDGRDREKPTTLIIPEEVSCPILLS